MTLFWLLLAGHIVADFYLQPQAWIMCKVENKERSVGLLKHMGVHTGLTSVILFSYFMTFTLPIFIALLIIILSHYLIDIWKTYMGFTTKFFVIDQLSHIAILLIVSLWLLGYELSVVSTLLSSNANIDYVIYALAYLFAFKPLSILIQLLLRPYVHQFDAQEGNGGLQTAGEHIGALERILIITFVLIDQFAGVGFLLAAKSIFRFGDMRRQQDRKLTEYIMLGTLLSFTTAIAVGLLVKHIT